MLNWTLFSEVLTKTVKKKKVIIILYGILQDTIIYRPLIFAVVSLTFWRRIFFFQILAQPVFKM
jgi:hypothetical protein